jgi:hypothetical protein
MAKLAQVSDVDRPDARQRPDRFTSHALVEIRKFKNFPFFCHSGVLLDLSLAGFKLEFTGEEVAQAGDRYWLCIPLGPLGILGPSRLLCRIEVRWYDPKRRRIGGVFMELDRLQQTIIEQVVESLRERKAPL